LLPTPAAHAGSFLQAPLSFLHGRGHSHNDYQHARPLTDALEQKFYSVEADIWLHQGELLISHWGIMFKGSLEELYLKPLQKLVDERGSVYGDGKPFYLWVEIKDECSYVRPELNRILNRYPMLSVYTDHEVRPGPVTVILTGNEENKRLFTEEYPVRRATRDAEHFNTADPPADTRWSWYAIQWQEWMNDHRALRILTRLIHEKGRKLRLWDVPHSEDVWHTALEAQVDQISVDNLSWMRRFLDSQLRVRGF
jgi:hypothetical protein